MKRILVISDCPQGFVCSGVTRVQRELQRGLQAMGHECRLVLPHQFSGVISLAKWGNPCFVLPTLGTLRQIIAEIESFKPDHICMFAEGVLTACAEIYLSVKGISFSSVRQTRFDAICTGAAGATVGKLLDYIAFDFWHSFASVCIVPTPSLRDILCSRDAHPEVKVLPNGCDTNVFSPTGDKYTLFEEFERPIWLFVGRVSFEKNIPALLDLAMDGRIQGTVVVVGDGGDLQTYRRSYESSVTPIMFLGSKRDEELVRIYRSADVFVFPSKQDAFGIVMLEANACGVPVAAYRCVGPQDVVCHGTTGHLHDDLLEACNGALALSREAATKELCVAHAKRYSWESYCERFLELQPLTIASSTGGVSEERGTDSLATWLLLAWKSLRLWARVSALTMEIFLGAVITVLLYFMIQTLPDMISQMASRVLSAQKRLYTYCASFRPHHERGLFAGQAHQVRAQD